MPLQPNKSNSVARALHGHHYHKSFLASQKVPVPILELLGLPEGNWAFFLKKISYPCPESPANLICLETFLIFRLTFMLESDNADSSCIYCNPFAQLRRRHGLLKISLSPLRIPLLNH
jgi:hypothetical protein